MRKAREFAGLTQQQLSDAIGVSRHSISTYEGRGTNSRPVLLSWALCCGVSLPWLRDGTVPSGQDDPEVRTVPSGHRPLGVLAAPLRPQLALTA